MLHNIMTIFKKEFLEVVKDKRTLILMIALPTLLLPIILQLTVTMVQKAEKKSSAETISYAIVNGDLIPELEAKLSQSESFEKVSVPEGSDLREMVKKGSLKLGIQIGPSAKDQMAQGYPADVIIYFNNASVTSKIGRRGREIIRSASEEIRDRRLITLGLEGKSKQAGLLEPLAIIERGTADMREVLGERMGGMLPYFFVIFCFLGALYPAIDLAAGEKERGTLETLLLTPVPRVQLVLGKFFVIFSTGIISALLSISSIGVWLATKGQAVSGVAREIIDSISSFDLIMILVMLIPIAGLFASLLLSISIYAKSFKEAQSFSAPLNIFIILPAFMAMMPGVTLDWFWAMIPITNVSLAIKELVKGTIDYNMLWVILASSSAIALGLLFFCSKWFQREDVLFRE